MKLFRVVIMSFFVSAFAFAGGVVGGGGMGVVCINSDGKETVEVLDLFEARIKAKEIKTFSGDLSQDLMNIGLELYPKQTELALSFAGSSEMLSMFFQDIPSDTYLNQTDDALPAILPKNCVVKQIASFQHSMLVYVDGELYNKLDYVNKLALIVHEYLYMNERVGGVTDSRYTRAVIDRIFTKNEAPYLYGWVVSERLNDKENIAQRCETINTEKDTIFYVFKKGFQTSGNYQLVTFEKIGGHHMYSLNTGSTIFPKISDYGLISLKLYDTIVSQTVIEIKTSQKGQFLSWSGFYPGERIKNIEFTCENI